MEKTIVGYRMTRLEYEQAAKTIVNYYEGVNSRPFQEFMLTAGDRDFAQLLRKAGALELWFEPIYEEERKELRIEKGKCYYCIKDVVMEHNDEVAYTKDNVYQSDKDKNLPDNNDSTHTWSASDKISEYFRLATSEEIEVYNTPKPGDWYVCLPDYDIKGKGEPGAGHTEGKVFQVKGYNRGAKLLWPAPNGDGVYLRAVRRATPEEIKSAATKTLMLGDKDIQVVISKDSIEADGKKITIKQVKHLHDFMKVGNVNKLMVSPWELVVVSIKVGCTIFTVDDLNQIIKEYELLNKP